MVISWESNQFKAKIKNKGGEENVKGYLYY